MHLRHSAPLGQGGILIVVGLDALKELIVPQEARELTGQTSVIVGKKAIDAVGDEVAPRWSA